MVNLSALSLKTLFEAVNVDTSGSFSRTGCIPETKLNGLLARRNVDYIVIAEKEQG